MKFIKSLNVDWMGMTPVFNLVSGLLVVASIIVTAVMGINFGIDFAGGYEIQVKFDQAVQESKIQDLVKPLGLGDARVQRFGAAEDNEFLIMVREHGTIGEEGKAKLKADFEQLAGGGDAVSTWSMAESGENLLVGFNKPVTEAQVREVIEGHGLQVKRVTASERADRPEYSVDLVSLADQIERALVQGLGVEQGKQIVQRVEFVGPQVGAQLRNQGVLAVFYSLLFILLYIAIRFDLFYAPGAVVALAHDVIITVGVFSLFQLEFSLQIVAALLTLVGYSLNDTIIVFDRIRENTARLRGRDVPGVVNTSINQTMSRTILTSGTTLFVVAALLFFGGEVTRGFAIALFVGIVIGTYSSIAIASPIYVKLRERAAKKTEAHNPAAAA